MIGHLRHEFLSVFVCLVTAPSCGRAPRVLYLGRAPSNRHHDCRPKSSFHFQNFGSVNPTRTQKNKPSFLSTWKRNRCTFFLWRDRFSLRLRRRSRLRLSSAQHQEAFLRHKDILYQFFDFVDLCAQRTITTSSCESCPDLRPLD